MKLNNSPSGSPRSSPSGSPRSSPPSSSGERYPPGSPEGKSFHSKNDRSKISAGESGRESRSRSQVTGRDPSLSPGKRSSLSGSLEGSSAPSKRDTFPISTGESEGKSRTRKRRDDTIYETYVDKRRKSVQALKDAGKCPYPYTFHASLSITDFLDKYQTAKEDSSVVESVSGRVLSIRSTFYDLYADGIKLQVYVGKEVKEEVSGIAVHDFVKRGDIVGVTGSPGFSKRDELTLYASNVAIVCPCLHELPNLNFLKTSPRAAGTIRIPNHSKTSPWAAGKIRNPKNYVLQPVETPILNLIPSGGAAQPYSTFDVSSKSPLYLRIAPELRLKELLVGGLGRVFEIGKQFRNEGIDSTHYPEFTSCEFYMSYADSEQLMSITETLLSGLVNELTGGLKIMFHSDGLDEDPIEIDFTPPFRRIDMIEELERLAKVKIPTPFSSVEARVFLEDLCKKCDIKFDPGSRTPRLLDKLVGYYLEGLCVNPTFIVNHPEIMSPMAKSHRLKPELTERFELFIDKKELCNAYTELNDPEEQRNRCEEQLNLLNAGDGEAMRNDESYCHALEYALPPCAGWGIGIDRLTMLLTDSQTIKEVILFTTMKSRVRP